MSSVSHAGEIISPPNFKLHFWCLQGYLLGCPTFLFVFFSEYYNSIMLVNSEVLGEAGGSVVCPQLWYMSAKREQGQFKVMPLCITATPGKLRGGGAACLTKTYSYLQRLPGSFLIGIPRYTAKPHLLIIQEESCRYLMLCCRVFSWCTVPARFSSLGFFGSIFLLYLVSCKSIPLSLTFFFRNKSCQESVRTCVCGCVFATRL